MSYTIYYNKQFVRLSDGRFVIMIEGGDNNVWEYNNKRRARDWYIKRKDGSVVDAWTKEEIEAHFESMDKSARSSHGYFQEGKAEAEKYPYDQKYFGNTIGLAMKGKRCSNTTFADYKAFYKSGMKNALTFEQLAKFNVYLTVSLQHYNKEDLEKRGIKDFVSQDIHTEEEFLQAVKTCETHGQLLSVTAYICDGQMDRIKKEFSPRSTREKHPKDIEKYFALEVFQKGTNYYIGNFIRASKSGFKYSYSEEGGKRYLTEKEAEAAASKQAARFTSYDFRKKEMNRKVTVYV